MLHIQLFGEFCARSAKGEELCISTRKTQWLLAYLLLHRGAHTREHLASLFWPESSQARASNSLRQALHSLKASLKRVEDCPCSSLLITTSTVEFSPKIALSLDTEEFTERLRECQDLDDDAQSECLECAISLYRGDLLEDCDAPWCAELRAYFRDHYVQALGQLIHLYIQQKEYETAIKLCGEVLTQIPWHEITHRQLMYLHFICGNRSAAIQQYRECKRILRKELNVDPLPETDILYHTIAERIRPIQFEVAIPASDAVLHPYPELGSPFVGRVHQCERLLIAWNAAQAGKGQGLFIAGEAGIGKSRLAQEFLGQVAQRKAFVFQGRCYEIEGKLPFQSLIDALRRVSWAQIVKSLEDISPLWLAEVSKLLPELLQVYKDLPTSAPLSHLESERHRLFEALTQLFLRLSEKRPLVLFIDDLHWCDESTLQFIQYLLRRISDKKILFLGAYRSEEIDATHGLHMLLQPLERDHQASHLTIGSMPALEITALVREMFKTEGLRGLSEWLYEQSRGIPLVAVELIKSFLDAGVIRFGTSSEWIFDREKISAEHVPRSVRSLIETRLRRLSARCRQLLDLASAMSGKIDVNLLLQTLRRQDILEDLEALLGARLLIDEQGAYYFRHDLIRQFVYNTMLAERRREFHRSIAAALEASPTHACDAYSAALAHHYTQANSWEKALEYSLKAGITARSVYSNENAVRHLRQAAELAERLKDPNALKQAYSHLCEVCVHSGKVDEGLEYGRKALELMKDVYERSRIYINLAIAYNYKVEHEKALECCDRAINELNKEKDCLEKVRACMMAMLELYQMSRCQEAIKRGQAGLRILKSIPDRRTESFIYANLGVAHIGLEDYETANMLAQQAVKLAKKSSAMDALAEAYYCLGFIHSRQGDGEKTVRYMEQSLALYEKMGDITLVAWCMQTICWGHILSQSNDKAKEVAEQCLQRSIYLASPSLTQGAYAYLGCILFAEGKRSRAHELWSKALRSSLPQVLFYRQVIQALTVLGCIDQAIFWLGRGTHILPALTKKRLTSAKYLRRLQDHPDFLKLVNQKIEVQK